VAGREGAVSGALADAIEIRQGRATDAEMTSAYMHELLAEGLDVYMLPNPAPSPEKQVGWIEQIGQTPHAFVLIAQAGRRVVGILDFRPAAGRGRTPSGSFGMSVARDFRRMGIGRRMVEAMIAHARRDRPDLCRIELEVVPWNTRAIALYERLGFRREAVKEKAIQFRGKPEPLLLMARTW
jgi:RimJ/RimL family protein N-acetyltransferase